MVRNLTFFSFALLGIFFLTYPAFACDCPAATIQARSEQADTILIVEVLGHRGKTRNMVSTDVRVVKSYKGSFRQGQKLVLGDGADAREDSCRVGFASETPGNRWLIFARSAKDLHKGRWLIRNCGRSAPVEFAKHDIQYLDRIHKYRGRTRIYGFAYGNKVSYASRSIRGTVTRGPGPRLRFIGEGRVFTIRAQADGFFELIDIPPGLYKARVELPIGATEWYINRAFCLTPVEYDNGTLKYGPLGLTVNPTDAERAEGAYTILVPDIGDAEINFRIDTNYRLSGRVFGPDGRPIPHALVSVASYDAVSIRDHAVRADKDGRYEISNNLGGRYVIGVNLRNSLSPEHPYGALYFPGIASRSRSKVIQLGVGTEIEDADLHIPAFRPLVTLSGKLIFADGSPVTDGFVRFVRDGNFQADYDEVKIRVTPDGRFRLRVVKGERGSLTGGVTMVSEGVDGCVNKTQPMVDNDYQKGFKRLWSYDKNAVATRNVSDLIIKFIQSPCR